MGKRPTRDLTGLNLAIVTAWPCTRWGLPCREPHSPRGALLPHHFTLTSSSLMTGARHPARGHPAGGGIFSVALSLFVCTRSRGPGLTNGGRYPPPWFSGARTFLPSINRGAAFHTSSQLNYTRQNFQLPIFNFQFSVLHPKNFTRLFCTSTTTLF